MGRAASALSLRGLLASLLLLGGAGCPRIVLRGAADASAEASALDVPALSDAADARSDPAPPRLLAPSSGSELRTNRPLLRWAFPEPSEGAQVELCRDRACARVVSRFDVRGSSATTPAPLPPGAYFWRARAVPEGGLGEWSLVWEFFVPRRSVGAELPRAPLLDLDGDGLVDLAVGDPDVRFRGTRGSGAVALYRGAQGGLEGTEFARLRLEDEQRFGAEAEAAGDVDGDGFADLLVGAPRDYPQSMDGIGRVFLFYGNEGGLRSILGQRVLTGGERSLLGVAARGLGDVDGDGYADVAVSEPGAGAGGRVQLLRGGRTGLQLPARWTLENPTTNSAESSFGSSLAAGDFDGDGYVDLLVGAPRADSFRGSAHLYFGSAAGFLAPPRSDLERPPLTGRLGAPPGAVEGPYFGLQVNTVGDLNGDGLLDFAVGAPFDGAEGMLALYLGSRELRVRGVVPPSRVLRGGADSWNLGVGFASPGDLDGDGCDELVVGVPFGAADGVGRARVYWGNRASILADSPQILVGSRAGNLGWVLSIPGDLNGDSYPDLVLGNQATQGAIEGFLGGPSGFRPSVVIAPAWAANFGQVLSGL